MPEQLDINVLRSLISRHLAVDASVSFQGISTGKFNTSFMVDGADRPLVLRIAPPDDAGFVFYERKMMAQEPGIHSIIRSRTSAPVAEILVYDDSRSLVDRDFLIMERLPGRPLCDVENVTRGMYDRVMFQVGEALRQIHGITADRYGYLGEHHPMEPQSNWNDAFFIMWNRMIDDIVECGYYNEAEAADMRGKLDRNMRHFNRETPSMLLHMDIWSQNILVDESGNLTGLIDLDRALWGDPEIEFAVLDYCGISEPAFWRGYGSERDTSVSAEMRTLLYLLYELQKYIVIRHYRQKDHSTALRYKAQVMQLAGRLL